MAGQLEAFFALILFAFVGSIILLVTAVWSSTVKRQPAWYSLLVSNAIAAATYSILLVSGNKSVRDPPFGICVTQAALGYATPVLVTGTTLTLVVKAFLGVKAQISGTAGIRKTNATVLIIGFPYILHGIMFIASLIVGLGNPTTVRREDGFYCTFIIRTPARTSGVISICLTLIAICFLGAMFWCLRGHWKTMGGKTIRILLFFFFCLGVVITASLVPDSTDQNLDVILACLPVAAVLIFGTARDIGRAWMFWKRNPVLAPASVRNADEASDKVETSQVV
ncbi:hypothetical protein BKA70DRAFT_59222 [Coprinopsis sp. MPI-PUGE-AT-0042]|nr:hypothetical protein BKA70DRAFT_59222 [Coprinopsis sp. MPI-PUGE-AT-0042]